MKNVSTSVYGMVLVACVIGCLSGCITAPPKPDEIVAPEPIANNSGKYMSPYTQDEVLAEWVDKAINVSVSSSVGATVGTIVGQQALKQIPFIGGFIGRKAGEAAGREIAIKASGGRDYIKSTSDLSFNSVDNLAVFLYAKYSTNEHYKGAFKATCGIYPDLKNRYMSAISRAPRKQGVSK